MDPRVVDGLHGQVVVAASCGKLHTVVLTEEGNVWSWGAYSHGQLGTGDVSKKVCSCRVVLQHTATHALQRTATHCNTLQHTATHCKAPVYIHGQLDTGDVFKKVCPCLVVMQHTATRCNTLQHAATHCNTLRRARSMSWAVGP